MPLYNAGGEKPKKSDTIVIKPTEKDKELAGKDSFTTSLFGGMAADVYARGYRPRNINGDIVIAPTGYTSSIGDLEGGGQLGFMQKGKKFMPVRIKGDGSYEPMGTKGYDEVSAKDAIGMMDKFFIGRQNQLAETAVEAMPMNGSLMRSISGMY